MPDVKKIAFTFITVVIVPLLFFVVLELGLMAAGVGQSFDYFREIDINGEPHYQENPDFADQFYPCCSLHSYIHLYPYGLDNGEYPIFLQ